MQNGNKNYYIQIADWMLDFNLPINELLTYAIIYGYCQTGENCYYGSTKTMAELLGLGKEAKGHASEYLNTLEEKGLLHKDEIKVVDKQKMCKYYVTTDREGRVDEQDVDYITIQPWMLSRYRNGLLMVYARIQNLSRNKNVYFYNPDDLKKWINTNCSNKELKRSYIKKLLNNRAIEKVEIGDIEAYTAIIPDEIKHNTDSFKSGGLVPKVEDFDVGVKNGTPVAKTEHLIKKGVKYGTHGVKNGTNNLITLNLDNLVYIINDMDKFYKSNFLVLKNEEVESGFNIEKLQLSKYVQEQMHISLEAHRNDINVGIKEITSALKLIDEAANVWQYPNIRKMNQMSDKQYQELYNLALELTDKERLKYSDPDSNLRTPEKIISIKLRKIIGKNEK